MCFWRIVLSWESNGEKKWPNWGGTNFAVKYESEQIGFDPKMRMDRINLCQPKCAGMPQKPNMLKDARFSDIFFCMKKVIGTKGGYHLRNRLNLGIAIGDNRKNSFGCNDTLSKNLFEIWSINTTLAYSDRDTTRIHLLESTNEFAEARKMHVRFEIEIRYTDAKCH